MSEEQEKHPDLKRFMALANLIGENGLDHPATRNFMLNNPKEWQIIKGMLTKQDIEFLEDRSSKKTILNGDNFIITKPTAYLMNTTNAVNALAKYNLTHFIEPTPLAIAYEKENGKKTNEVSAEIFLQVEIPAEVEILDIHNINSYDLSVYDAVCTLWNSENEFMTLSMIAREVAPKHETELLKVSDGKRNVTTELVKTEEKTNYVTSEMRAVTLFALKKLANTPVIVDYRKHYDLKGIQDGITREKGKILEFHEATMRQKGVDTDGFRFREPLLHRYSKNVKHIETISKKTIDLNVNMTPEVIAIRRYILHRYHQIKESHEQFSRYKGSKGKQLQERQRTIRYEPILEQVEKVKIDTLEAKLKLLKGETPEAVVRPKKSNPEAVKKKSNLEVVKKEPNPEVVKNQIEKLEKDLMKLKKDGLTDRMIRTTKESIEKVMASLKENGEFTDFKTATDKGKRAKTKVVITV